MATFPGVGKGNAPRSVLPSNSAALAYAASNPVRTNAMLAVLLPKGGGELGRTLLSPFATGGKYTMPQLVALQGGPAKNTRYNLVRPLCVVGGPLLANGGQYAREELVPGGGHTLYQLKSDLLASLPSESISLETLLSGTTSSVVVAADTQPLVPSQSENPLTATPVVTPEPAPTSDIDPNAQMPPPDPVKRKWIEVNRIVRDTAVTAGVKELHDHICQVCNIRLETPAGCYAEGAHIHPLKHEGPDVRENVLCLCPNCHVLFDYGAFSIRDDFTLIERIGRLRTSDGHKIDQNHLRHHRLRFGFDLS